MKNYLLDVFVLKCIFPEGRSKELTKIRYMVKKIP